MNNSYELIKILAALIIIVNFAIDHNDKTRTVLHILNLIFDRHMTYMYKMDPTSTECELSVEYNTHESVDPFSLEVLNSSKNILLGILRQGADRIDYISEAISTCNVMLNFRFGCGGHICQKPYKIKNYTLIMFDGIVTNMEYLIDKISRDQSYVYDTIKIRKNTLLDNVSPGNTKDIIKKIFRCNSIKESNVLYECKGDTSNIWYMRDYSGQCMIAKELPGSLSNGNPIVLCSNVLEYIMLDK